MRAPREKKKKKRGGGGTEDRMGWMVVQFYRLEFFLA